jgi:ABC-2 type transport system ATP-binding protein
LIVTEDLTRKFGDLVAVDRLTLTVGEGEVFGLLGPNGAGKTTTIRMLAGLISITSGKASIAGHEIGKGKSSLAVRKMIGLLPEVTGLYEELSVYRNLDYYGRLYEYPDHQRKERIEYLLGVLGLWEKRESPVAVLSKGMKRRLALVRALVHDPEVVFLDEPTANLDPQAAKTVRDMIMKLKEERKTVFLNTHNLEEAQRICDRIGIMKTSLLKVGSADELKETSERSSTIIEVEMVTDAIVAAVRRLTTNFTVDGNRLIVAVSDPQKENPRLVESLVAAGGKILFVSRLTPTLEEAYLRLVETK